MTGEETRWTAELVSGKTLLLSRLEAAVRNREAILQEGNSQCITSDALTVVVQTSGFQWCHIKLENKIK